MHALLLLMAATQLAAQTLPRARAETVGMSSERLNRITPGLQSYIDRGQLAGSVLLVARNGRLVYHQGFGAADREANVRMQPDAMFRIASQSKALVSVATMVLQEHGALLISDPVGKYIPEFQRTKVAVAREGAVEVVDARRPITLRDLLTHTAGIGYGLAGPARAAWEQAGITGWYFAHRDEPVAATVARMAALPFDAHPGDQFVYGYATDILGVVLEKVTGRPLDVVLDSLVIRPLRMKDTHFYPPAEKRNRLTAVYAATANGGVERAPAEGTMNSQGAYLDGPRVSFSGGAGLISTAGDYARFLQMLLNGGELEGARILSPKSVQLMTVNHIGNKYTAAGQGFGLGFSVVNDLGARGALGSFGEFGWGGAYHSTYWVDPVEKLVVVYLTQLIPARTIDDFAKVRALVYQAITESYAR